MLLFKESPETVGATVHLGGLVAMVNAYARGGTEVQMAHTFLVARGMAYGTQTQALAGGGSTNPGVSILWGSDR